MPNDKDVFRQMIAFSDACESSESYRIVSEAQKGTIETAGALPGLLGPLTLRSKIPSVSPDSRSLT